MVQLYCRQCISRNIVVTVCSNMKTTPHLFANPLFYFTCPCMKPMDVDDLAVILCLFTLRSWGEDGGDWNEGCLLANDRYIYTLYITYTQ